MARQGLWISPNQFVEFAGVRPDSSLAQQIATRDKSIDFSSLLGYLPNPDPILKKLGMDQTVYEEVKADGNVSACISNRKAGVMSLKWAISRGKARTQQATFIEDLFNDLDLIKIIREILDAPLYGYRVMEIAWANINSRWIPTDVIGKPSRWFVFDDEGNLRMKTRLNIAGEIMPPEKFLVACHEASYDNPYGDALLSKCFWPMTFKKGGLKFWVVLAEKFGIPHLIGKHQPGAGREEINKLLDAMESLIQDAVAAIPNTASIEPLEAGTKSASSSLFKDLLTYCKSEISLVLLGQTLTTEVGERGSYAAAQVHSEIREDIVQSDKHLVESTLNDLIDRIIGFNFGDSAERPKFELYREDDVDKNLAERDNTLVGTGQLKFTRNYYKRAYGFADDEIIVDETPPAAQEFSEKAPKPDPQSALDEFTESLDPELQTIAQDLLQPVFDLVQSATSYDEMLNGLAALYPDLDTSALEEKLEKAMFLSESWGRLNAKG